MRKSEFAGPNREPVGKQEVMNALPFRLGIFVKDKFVGAEKQKSLELSEQFLHGCSSPNSPFFLFLIGTVLAENFGCGFGIGNCRVWKRVFPFFGTQGPKDGLGCHDCAGALPGLCPGVLGTQCAGVFCVEAQQTKEFLSFIPGHFEGSEVDKKRRGIQ